MKRFILLFISMFLSSTAFAQGTTDWKDVEDAFRTTGKMVDTQTFKIVLPRADLTVTRGDVKLAPEFGLESEVKFTGRPEKAMMMADLVLLEKEVGPVMLQLQNAGFDITALHNHLFGTDPSVLYMHVSGTGAAKGLANGLKNALAQTATPIGTPEASAPSAPSPQWTTVQSVVGRKGDQKGDVLEIVVPRKEKVTHKGMAVPPFMGAAHCLYFQKSGADKVAATGDLVLLDREVNQVAKILKSNKFEVTAIHNHDLFENPRLFYLHYFAQDTPDAVARTLRRALDVTTGASVPAARGGVPPIR